MSTPKNYDAYLQTVKDVLKKAWKSDAEIEAIINQIKDKPKIIEGLFNATFQITKLWFVFKYPKNATEEEKQRLLAKALKKQLTKQALADSTKKPQHRIDEA